MDKEHRFQQAELERKAEEERIKRRNEIREEILREKQESMLDDFFSDIKSAAEPKEPPAAVPAPEENEDDLLASFFTDVAGSKDAAKEEARPQESEESEKVVVLTEKYAQQDLGSGRDQCARLLGHHYQWKNLNPFYVLQLDIDANDEDIKFRYKKLSLKVHPDRLRDIENARDAFEQVKDAYAKLMDPDQRKTLVMHFENVTGDLLKERRKQLSKGVHIRTLTPSSSLCH